MAGHFVLVGDTVLGDGRGGQALQADELERVDLAAGDGLEHVERPLRARVPKVDVRAVRQEELHDLKDHKKISMI